ncbi:hypothetical protein RCL_jg19991.t1 [Rhizophagus clarus]|uniref:Uncharacterized protein n=1 Tax=Rhizophagus clarus TaxID=94130 RepID=A0A8H3LC99_9GLOM|nr:hypothetical protein RCL_jg19991.t1 [Rhizophagus clarus]
MVTKASRSSPSSTALFLRRSSRWALDERMVGLGGALHDASTTFCLDSSFIGSSFWGGLDSAFGSVLSSISEEGSDLLITAGLDSSEVLDVSDVPDVEAIGGSAFLSLGGVLFSGCEGAVFRGIIPRTLNVGMIMASLAGKSS